MYGEGGNDTFYARDGRTDTLGGGSGSDRAQRDNTAPIIDVLISVESTF
jgi:hypothetical protein